MAAWCAGDRRLSAGGVTSSHEADAWVRTGFASQTKESRRNCKSLYWCLKAQVSDFPIFLSDRILCFFMVYTSLASGGRSVYEMDLPSTRGATIQAIPGPSSIFWPSFTNQD